MNKNELNELALYLKSLPRLADTDKDQRVQRSLDDFWYFITTYFHHHVDFAKAETSEFRRFIQTELYGLTQKHKIMQFDAYRGAAKTTTITQLFTLWMLVKKEIRFGVLISSTDTLAGLIFELYKAELEDNQSFNHDFNITLPSTWREKELVVEVDGHLCKLVGYGAGKKLRGIKFLSYRPDYIILDDVENDEQVESKAQRDKLESWFKKAVMKLPSRKKHYRLIIVGTILHNDGLLKRLAKRSDVQSFSFPLVRQFPDDVDNPDSIDGLILDDPEIDGFEVMRDYFEDKDSFMSEYQGQPISSEGLAFENYTTFEVMPKCDVYYLGLDPAMGKKKGDYFGVATLGMKTVEGRQRFYLSVKGYRMSPVKLIGRIIANYSRLSRIAPTTIACEVVQFQEFFKDVLKKEAADIGIPLAVKELRNTAPKALRIDSLAPLINDGTIAVQASDNLLIEELDTYPSAAHDDLLDAAEMAYRIFRGGGTLNYKQIREKLKKRDFSRFKNKYS